MRCTSRGRAYSFPPPAAPLLLASPPPPSLRHLNQPPRRLQPGTKRMALCQKQMRGDKGGGQGGGGNKREQQSGSFRQGATFQPPDFRSLVPSIPLVQCNAMQLERHPLAVRRIVLVCGEWTGEKRVKKPARRGGSTMQCIAPPLTEQALIHLLSLYPTLSCRQQQHAPHSLHQQVALLPHSPETLGTLTGRGA